MIDLNLDDHKWEIVTNKTGTHAWIECPFCGMKLTHQLTPAYQSSNEATIALLLENHLAKCEYQSKAVDLATAEDSKRYGFIISYLVVAHDDRVWHYLDYEDSTKAECFLKRIYADKASLKSRIDQLRQEKERITRELRVLERASSLQIVNKT